MNSKCVCAQSCLTLCNPMDCSPPGSSVHGILQARILERVAISSSRGSSQPRNWTRVSCIAGGFFTTELQVHTESSLAHFFLQPEPGTPKAPSLTLKVLTISKIPFRCHLLSGDLPNPFSAECTSHSPHRCLWIWVTAPVRALSCLLDWAPQSQQSSSPWEQEKFWSTTSQSIFPGSESSHGPDGCLPFLWC